MEYWCHMCSHIVNPLMEASSDDIKCPFCSTGFVQQMSPPPPPQQQQQQQQQQQGLDILNQHLEPILARRRQLTAAFELECERARSILRDYSPQTANVDYDDHYNTFLQPFAASNPDRHATTPPACKEAIKSLPSVKIDEDLQCHVCLGMFEIGKEAKMMPCKHKFHGHCLLPWLELHSSCPVCRSLLPAGETKTE